ncbi:MAG TPA: acyl carrier protein [Polyangiaceae bacterium]|nr:acyl carrier protein [Polyangiaceae bacterium]
MSQAATDTIRRYLLTTFFEGEDPALLKDDTALISSGVINSLVLMKLVAFLESTFGVRIKAHEMNADYLDTIAQMAQLVGERRTT